MKSKQTTFCLVLLLSLAKLSKADADFSNDLVVSHFDVTTTNSTVFCSLKEDYYVIPFMQTVISPYVFFITPKHVVFKGNKKTLAFDYLDLSNHKTMPSGISPNILFEKFKELKFNACSGSNNILVTNNLRFSGCESFIISNNCSIINSGDSYFCCFKATNCSVTNNRQVLCKGNCYLGAGSVFKSQKLLFSNNDLFIVKDNAAVHGGPFEATTFFLDKNGLVEFSGNSSTGTWVGGGASVVLQSFNITQNKSLKIVDNKSALNGGAFATPRLVISGNGSCIFRDNFATKQGGAIHIHTNDRSNAPEGDPCLLDILADSGNVLFTQNHVRNAIRNCVTIENGVSRLKLNAKTGYSIHFDDPIVTTFKNVSNNNKDKLHDITYFNKKDSQSPNKGKIIFSASGIDVEHNPTSNSSSDIVSRTSRISGTIVQEDGVISVKDGAIFSPWKFDQTGGWLILGASGTCATLPPITPEGTPTEGNGSFNPYPASSLLTLSHLGIDVEVLLEKKPSSSPNVAPQEHTPRLAITKKNNGTSGGGGTVTLTPDTDSKIIVKGPINLTNEDLDLYEASPLMSHSISDLELLVIDPRQNGSPSSKNIDVSEVDLKHQPDHYGYQGYWQLYWKNDPTTANTTTLIGSWIPNQLYIPNPEKDGKFIADTLSSSLSSLDTFISALIRKDFDENRYVSPKGRFLWRRETSLIGIGSKINRSKSFNSDLAGSLLALSSTSPYNNRLGVAIAYLRQKDSHKKLSQRNYNHQLSFAIYSDFFPDSNSLYEIHTGIGYSLGDNTLKSKYSNGIKTFTSTYKTHTLGFFSSFYLYPIQQYLHKIFIDTNISPFVSINFTGAKLAQFKEDLPQTRSFTMEHYPTLLTTPIGIRINFPHRLFKKISFLKTHLAFSPTLSHKTPELIGSVFSNTSWRVSGNKISKHAFDVDASYDIFLSPNMKISSQYSLSTSAYSRSQSVNIGALTTF